MSLLWLAACWMEAPTAPTLAVDARWPGHDVEEVDAQLSTTLSEALGAEAALVRCEALQSAVRCLVEGAAPPAVDAALRQAELALPDGVEGLTVRPLPPPAERSTWLVLDDVPAAWVWDPAVVVHRRWPLPQAVDGPGQGQVDGVGLEPAQAARCAGAPATALWVDQLPTVPPPDGVHVRTWVVEGAIHLQGPADEPEATEALAGALAGTPYCLVMGAEHAEAVVSGDAAALAAALPRFDVVPPRAISRRWALSEVPTEAWLGSLRALPGVLAARWVGPVDRPVTEWVVQPDAVAAHGLEVAEVVAALQGAAPVKVGGLVLPPPAPTHVPSADGPVPLAALATQQQATAPAVRVRVNGVPGGQLEVLVADASAQPAVEQHVAAPALDDWALRAHRP